MKRFYIAIAVLVIILGGCILAIVNFNSIIDTVVTDIDNLKLSISKNDLHDTEVKTQKFFDDWMESEKILSLYINHDTIDQITWSAGSLSAYLKTGEEGEYLASLDEIKTMIQHIYYYEIPSIYNMF